jgi:hypothetical protein
VSAAGEPEFEDDADRGVIAMSAEIENRFVKLMLSSTLKTIEALHDDVDAHATVRKHMLGICDGVRQRAIAGAGEDVSAGEATVQVDALISMIDEYFEYSGSPLFPGVELVRKSPPS